MKGGTIGDETGKSNKVKQKREKFIAGAIFVSIVIAWFCYLLLSHDPKGPLHHGLELNSGQMLTAKSEEIAEFETLINKGLPRANKLLEDGNFKSFAVVKSTDGTMSFVNEVKYTPIPINTGIRQLNGMLRSSNKAKKNKTIVAFSLGRVKLPAVGEKASIIIQMTNNAGVSATVGLPYEVKNGSVEYGFLHHLNR